MHWLLNIVLHCRAEHEPYEAMLLAGVNAGMYSFADIVPPHMNNTTSVVTPQNVMAGLADNQVWLFTTDKDKYVSIKHNQQLFNALLRAQIKSYSASTVDICCRKII